MAFAKLLFSARWRRRWFVAVAVCLAELAAAQTAGDDAIDSRDELTLGAVRVSRYQVEKHRARWRASRPAAAGEPSPAELGLWAERCAAEHAVIAHALQLGFGERPEVQSTVARMERHMLTQPEGPFYARLAGEGASAGAKPGGVAGPLGPEEFARRTKLRDARRALALAAAAFRWEESAAQRVLALLGGAELKDGLIPEPLLAPLADEPLAYVAPATPAWPATVGEWAANFNRRFVRRVPHDVAALREDFTDMLREEFDLRAARAAGIDATPRFRADRENFHRFQTLDLFEREVLLPQLAISPAEVRAAYEAEPARYLRPRRVTGRLFTFRTAADAAGFVAGAVMSAPGAAEIAESALSANAAPAGLDFLWPLVLGQPAQTRFGPFPHGGRWIVWERVGNFETERIPLDEAASPIAERLRRERLSDRVRALASTLVAQWGADAEVAAFCRRWSAPAVTSDAAPAGREFLRTPRSNQTQQPSVP